MDQQRIFAIIIGAVMLTSVAGFAVTGLRFTGNTSSHTPQEGSIQITSVNEFLLPSQVILQVLSNGGTVIESVYNKDCVECAEKDAVLRTFVAAYPQFAILESVATTSGDGQEKLQLITGQGQIIDLQDQDLTAETMFDAMCQYAVLKPRECLLQTFDSPTATFPENTLNTTELSG